MCFSQLRQQEPEQRWQQEFTAFSRVVDELEEPEIQRQSFLGNAAMRAQPGPQQRPEAFNGVDMNLVKAVTVFITVASSTRNAAKPAIPVVAISRNPNTSLPRVTPRPPYLETYHKCRETPHRCLRAGRW